MLKKTTASGRGRTKIRPNLYQRESDGKFEAKWTDETGRWRSKTLAADTITAAKAEQDAWLTSVRKGEAGRVSDDTLSSFADKFLAQADVKPRTKDLYEARLRLHVLPTLGRKKLHEVKPEHIVSILVRLKEKGKAEWTRSGVLTAVSALFSYAVEIKAVSQNPASLISKKRRPKPNLGSRLLVLHGDEIESFLDNVPQKWHPVVYTALYTGARQSEILGLRWSEVQLPDEDSFGVIRLRYQLSRATNKRPAERVLLKTEATEAVGRDIDIDPGLVSYLKLHRATSVFNADSDYVFCTEKGTPLYCRNLLDRGFYPARDKLPEEKHGLRFHDLRHTYVSLLISSGADPAYVARQVGDKIPTVLNVYAKYWDDGSKRENAMRALAGSRQKPEDD